MASQWYFDREGERQGPVTSQQLRAMASQGLVTPSTLVWREGFDEWVPASKVSGLFGRESAEAGAAFDGQRPEEAEVRRAPRSSTQASGSLPLADRIL